MLHYIFPCCIIYDELTIKLVVKMKNGRCKYQNTFLSASKCLKNTLSGARYDNGRLLEFKTACYVMTDVDAKYLIDAYSANEDFEYEKVHEYVENNFEKTDSHACDRIIDWIIKGNLPQEYKDEIEQELKNVVINP